MDTAKSAKPKNYRFWFLSPASGWFVEWAFKQIMANMGRYHVRHHVANPLIARPQSSYNKMIQPPDPSLSAQYSSYISLFRAPSANYCDMI